MKVTVRVFAALALVSVFIAFTIFFSRPTDPAFEGRLTSQWTQDLLSPDYKIRGKAQAAIIAVGEPAVPHLRALLRRRNGPWAEHLPRVKKFLPFVNDRVIDANLSRTRAAEMLGSLGIRAHSAVPDLVSSLAYEQSAAESERALTRIGDGSIPSIEQGLRSRKAAVRERSARLLREFDTANASSIKLLIAATSDHAGPVRKEAALSLGSILSTSKKSFGEEQRPNAFPALLRLARDKDFRVRAAAFMALARFGDATPQVLGVLHPGLEDPEPVVQLQAAKSLWALHQDPARLIPVLTRILGTSERWQAAYALGEMGACASAAVPALAQLLREERVPRPFRTPPSAAFALGKIGAAAVPAVLLLLENSDSRVRMNALMAFGFMGTAGRDAIPHLIRYLQDENLEV
ncbi:MAG: HEAT repeat domain-containing protein, partial [Limisphaerales bacterium]